ncbi:hypothetical protein Tco_0277607 [Tanacetum coccineum]
MKNGREMTPPLGFSTPPQIPNITTSERPPVTTTVFAATTPENTSFVYHASTLTNPNPMISPAFVEANYEILEYLLRERQRQTRNEDLQTELEYFSEDYDEERDMEPRPEPRREATPTLRLREAISLRLTWGETSLLTIEDYPLLDGIKMPSHIGSYDGKGGLDNFLHLFEGDIRMQKWLMLVACHMFTYTLKDSARIWWNSQKTGLMEKTYTWVEAREVATNGVLNNRKDDSERSRKFSWEKVAKTFEQPPRLPGANWSKDKTRYCHFHEDYGHETNQCRELKHQIEEAVKSGQLTHLVKGLKEKKEKTTGTRLEERRKEEKRPILNKSSVLMISRKTRNEKKRSANHGKIGEITFPPLLNVGSADPVIIKAYISGRQIPLSGLKHSSCRLLRRTTMALGRNTLGDYNWGGPHHGATYQRLIDKVFGHQIGRNMEVNADDMVIMSDSEEEMMVDITETLEKLRAINLKLNPKKCSFGVE